MTARAGGWGGVGSKKAAAPAGLPAPTTACGLLAHAVPFASRQPVVGPLVRFGVWAKLLFICTVI